MKPLVYTVFAWEAYDKGSEVHLQADPTKLELLYKSFKVKKEDFKAQQKESILEKVTDIRFYLIRIRLSLKPGSWGTNKIASVTSISCSQQLGFIKNIFISKHTISSIRLIVLFNIGNFEDFITFLWIIGSSSINRISPVKNLTAVCRRKGNLGFVFFFNNTSD